MRVSVIVPTYNYAFAICNAIESVIQQDYPDIELIIIDDGSTDNTDSLVQGYKSKFENIIYIKQNNKGKAAATFKGYELSTGQILFNLDADDIFLPGKLRQIVKIYESNSSVSMIGHAARIDIDGEVSGIEDLSTKPFVNKILNGKDLVSIFLKNNILYGGGSTFSMRKSFVELNEKIAQADMYIDEYLVYKAAYAGDVMILSTPLSVWNIHGSNYSITAKSSARQDKKKQFRLLKSSEGELYLLRQFLQERVHLTLFRIKHLERASFFYQKTTNYARWFFSSISILLELLHLLLLGVNIITIARNYHLAKRFAPPFIYNAFKKNTTD